MKTTHTRKPLHKQSEPEQKGPFFAKANEDVKKKDDVFFQTKLAVGEPGDKHEQEADSVADKVQKKTEEKKEKPDVQKKGKEEEKPAVAGGTAKEEDKGKISKKEEEKKEPVQKKEAKEEEKPVQKMSGNDKKEDDKTSVKKKENSSGDNANVMKKEAGGVHPAAHPVSLEERIKQSKGKGQSLSDEVRSFLEAELGADFTEVVIHTDNEAIAMNQELNSLAFTTGYDIYFNAGQYKPDTVAGQKLLAHELTHVVQQTGVSKRKDDKKDDKK